MVKHRKLVIVVLGICGLLAVLFVTRGFWQEKPEKKTSELLEKGSTRPVRGEDIDRSLRERFLTDSTFDVAKAIVWMRGSVLKDRSISVLETGVDRRSKRFPSLAQSSEEGLWKILGAMPLNCKPATMRRLCRRAEQNKEILQAELFLAKYADPSQISEHAQQVVEAADQLKKGEDIRLRDAVVKAELPYFVLPDDKDTFSRLVDLYLEGPIDYFPFVIDACSFTPRDRLPTDILDTLKEAVLTTELRHKLYGRIMLCYFVAHLRPSGWQEILEEIMNTQRYIMENGKPDYEFSGPKGRKLLNVIGEVEDLMKFSYPYSRAESRNERRRLLRKVEPHVGRVPYKAWLIYRYDSEYFRVLWRNYQKREKLAVSANDPFMYMGTLLSEVLKLHSLVPLETVSFTEIREFTYNQDSLIKTVNGLFLLQSIASEQDIERLLRLARETANLEWHTEEGNVSRPLVALRAVNCLAQIVTPEGRNALQKIVRDEDLPERVREHARKKLNTIEKRLERK